MITSKNVFIKELETLVDCKIVGVVVSTDGQDFYGLKIADNRREETKILWFLRDEEGNGSGSFVIENFDTCEDFEEV
jgi:hypothetical protein